MAYQRKTDNPKMGRPKKKIEKKSFEQLCALQCTIEEMCCFFEVDDKTLSAWCKETYNKRFSEIFKIKRGKGLISLRRNQFRLAEKNPSMAIFLGKNYLQQRDNPEPEPPKDISQDLLNVANLLLNPKQERTEQTIEENK